MPARAKVIHDAQHGVGITEFLRRRRTLRTALTVSARKPAASAPRDAASSLARASSLAGACTGLP